MQQVSRSFRSFASKSLVKVRLTGNNIVTESEFLAHIVEASRKVEKLEIEEAIIDQEYIRKLESAFLSEVLIPGTNETCGVYFKRRLKQIHLSNIMFHGDSQALKRVAVLKCVNFLSSFTHLETLDLTGLCNAPLVF